jgi:formyl-CoA transferase
MKELAEEQSLRDSGTIVEVEHPERGPYLSVGCPVKLSANDVVVERSPLLGEHSVEILTEVLGYSEAEITSLKEAGAI